MNKKATDCLQGAEYLCPARPFHSMRGLAVTLALAEHVTTPQDRIIQLVDCPSKEQGPFRYWSGIVPDSH